MIGESSSIINFWYGSGKCFLLMDRCLRRSAKPSVPIVEDGLPSSRKDSHQLFKRLERTAFSKDDVVVLNILEIGGEGSIVEWVEPLPRRGLLVAQVSEPHSSVAQDAIHLRLGSSSAVPSSCLPYTLSRPCDLESSASVSSVHNVPPKLTRS